MVEKQNNNQLSSDESEKQKDQRRTALRIVKEALIRANIPQMPPNDDFTDQRWRVSYKEENQDFVLIVQLNTVFSKAIFHTPLSLVAWNIMNEVELLLANPAAMEKLGVDESERESVIFDESVALTADYIRHLPIVLFHSLHQTLEESMISYIKKLVDYNLREWLDQQGTPQKKFTLLPNNKLKDITKLSPNTESHLINFLDEINKEFSIYRKGALSDRKVWLNNPQSLSKLPSDYEQLRLKYRKVKNEYKTQRNAFYTMHRRATENDWANYWQEFCEENFPDLLQTDKVMSYSASELAYRQLAESFGFSAGHMERIVKSEKDKAKRNINKTTNI